MKKLFLVIMCLILMLGLVACNNKMYTFKGKVVEINMNNIIVEPLENEDIRKTSDRIQISGGLITEFNPSILPEGTLVEIGYDGNITETYPAQINVITLRTIVEDESDVTPEIVENEIPTTVAYANWAENDGGLLQDKNCLNAGKFIFSDYPRLATFKFETKDELNEFKNKYKDTFTMNQGYNEIASFDEITENYDDDFFNSHSLILAYIDASSGSFRYGISGIIKENDTLVIGVKKTNNPEVYTADMAGWFLMAEVTKDYIKDCKEFDTQLWDK